MKYILPEKFLNYLIQPRIAHNWVEGWGYFFKTMGVSFVLSGCIYSVLPIESRRTYWESSRLIFREWFSRLGIDRSGYQEQVQAHQQAMLNGQASAFFRPTEQPFIPRRELIELIAQDYSVRQNYLTRE